MRIWMDNTGLLSAAQCLEGRADPKHDNDIRSLLQLATLVIFSNHIYLNGFDCDEVADRSQEIVTQFGTYGMTEDIISTVPESEETYARACKTTAELIAPSLSRFFNPEVGNLLGVVPPGFPPDLLRRNINCINLADESDGSEILQHYETNALKDKAVGAVEYMLATTPELRKSVRKIRSSYSDWNDDHRYQLNIFLRYHLNYFLGKEYSSTYAPAVGRADLVTQSTEWVQVALGKMIDSVATELSGREMGIPSTLVALLEHSKGEPHAILEVAMRFRERSETLRDTLESLSSNHLDGDPTARFKITTEIKKLGSQLRKDLGLEDRTRLSGAFDYHLFAPFVTMKGVELAKWSQERKESRRVAVLTEIVKSSAYSEVARDLWSKLQKLSRKHSRF